MGVQVSQERGHRLRVRLRGVGRASLENKDVFDGPGQGVQAPTAAAAKPKLLDQLRQALRSRYDGRRTTDYKVIAVVGLGSGLDL